MKFLLATLAAASMTLSWASPAFAGEDKVEAALAALEARIDALEAENRALQARIEARQAVPAAVAPSPVMIANSAAPVGPAPAVRPAPQQDVAAAEGSQNFVGLSPEYSYRMLDHAEDTNTKAIVQLEAIADGSLQDRVTLSGSAIAIATYQNSNTPDKFGYLMRNPTSANQIGETVTEAVLHSAQVAVTARVTDDVTAYAEFLYDPQQSFGAGTITALARNQIQLRRGWVMVGNLEKAPVYALIGKIDTPFGLQDTVNPFTNSTNWHAFAGLAYGAQVGVKTDGLLLRAMAIQGGAQFRSANTSVNGTNVPSKLNNFAVDGRYELSLGEGKSVMAGASYLHGSPYCQDYPIFHFNPCDDNVPAWAAYGRVKFGDLSVMGEYAKTTKVWPGSRVPDPTNPLSQFAAQKTEAFTVGSRFAFGNKNQANQGREFALSAEFSKFTAGAEDSPWERQNQAVLGLSWFPVENLNVFGEFVHVDGFAPLNFLSGGNLPGGATWSDREAATNVGLIGVQVAF